MTDLLIHPITKRSIDGIIKSPPHALLLVGPSGTGKVSLAVNIAEQILGLESTKLDDYAYSLHIRPEDGKAISIDSVRQLERFLSLKVPRNNVYNRSIIIEDADTLTHEAQNALLKTLEEPPQSTIVILTASHLEGLLPTIISRVQAISVQKPIKNDLNVLYGEDFSQSEIDKAYAVSAGLPGLMHAVLSDEDHPLKNATDQARSILSMNTYQRLLKVDELAKDKALATDIIYILQQMAHISLQSAKGDAARKWQKIQLASHNASEALRASGQPKLVLTNLMLQL